MSFYSTPQAVLAAYVHGTRLLDAALLASCFHPGAVMAGRLGDQTLAGDIAPFLADIAALKADGMDHGAMVMEIGPVTVTGAIASATVLSEGFAGTLAFEDRFHLLRGAQGWLITSKLFTTLPA